MVISQLKNRSILPILDVAGYGYSIIRSSDLYRHQSLRSYVSSGNTLCQRLPELGQVDRFWNKTLRMIIIIIIMSQTIYKNGII